jgi:hypothetical protein
VLSAGTYVLSTSNGANANQLNVYTAANELVARGSNGSYVTFTADGSTAYWFDGYWSGTNVRGDAVLQLELGSTPTPYVPYGHVGLEVQGRNLVTIDNAVLNDGGSYIAAGVTFTRANNVVTVAGTSSAVYPQSRLVAASHWLEVGETYTLSVETGELPSGGYLYAVVYESDSSSASNPRHLASSRNSNQVTFTVTKPYTYINIVAEGNGVVWSGSEARVQVERGSTATEYEPYHHTVTPIPCELRSLPDGTHDTLSVDGAGHVVVERKTGKVVLTGETGETWYYESVHGGFRLHSMTSEFAALENNSVNLYSSHFIPSAWSNRGTNGIIAFSSHKPVFCYTSITQDTASWLTWIAENNVEVVYPLATPTTEDLGYISMPEVSDGATVKILAEIQPLIDGSWWTVAGSDAGKAHEAQQARIETLPTGVKGNAESTYRTGNVNLTPANIGAAEASHTHSYLPLSGGTLTGNLYLKSSGINRDAANPSADQWGTALMLFDADNERIGIIEPCRHSDGSVSCYFRSYTENTSGTQYENVLELRTYRDGSRSVGVSDGAIWRSAIGAAATNHTHSYATTSDFPRITNGNEIRFDVNTMPSSEVDLCIGWAWSGGTQAARIKNYRFFNGNSVLAPVYASNIIDSDGYDKISKILHASNYMHVETANYGNFGVSWWSSDIRMKSNIEDSDVDALELVNAIKHRSFDMNDEHYPIGYIAQELEKLDPQLVIKVPQSREVNGVSYFTGDYRYQIDPNKVIPYLSKSIQQLSAENAELKRKNEELESRLEAIERKLGL